MAYNRALTVLFPPCNSGLSPGDLTLAILRSLAAGTFISGFSKRVEFLFSQFLPKDDISGEEMFPWHFF